MRLVVYGNLEDYHTRLGADIVNRQTRDRSIVVSIRKRSASSRARSYRLRLTIGMESQRRARLLALFGLLCQ
ncbi:hypothetical protein IQ235_16760 [Oscillatoriales cyanobacterium LEGE 11467]|uniref:Uncharacterized protein n=1 Tax=Zarconia navalis LEGE 11467 TaxID=1828826 RepID=A0A928VY45_9CYAN|nr:hypothetical protein [Zarconia navalis]MBE9042424.1 hypothetical protein [Zarconia navalis LEGE 11467]